MSCPTYRPSQPSVPSLVLSGTTASSVLIHFWMTLLLGPLMPPAMWPPCFGWTWPSHVRHVPLGQGRLSVTMTLDRSPLASRELCSRWVVRYVSGPSAEEVYLTAPTLPGAWSWRCGCCGRSAHSEAEIAEAGNSFQLFITGVIFRCAQSFSGSGWLHDFIL